MVLVVVRDIANSTSFALTGSIESVGHLKFAIDWTRNIPIWTQMLVHDGVLMMDSRAELSAYNVHNHGEIQLFHKLGPRPIHVRIKSEATSLLLEVSTKESVLSLKMRIDESEGISPHRQILSVLGVTMQEYHSISEYITCAKPTFYLQEIPPDSRWMLCLYVIVPSSGSQMWVEVEEHDTVYTMHGVLRRAGLARGHNFFLVCGNQRLSGLETLDDYEIQNGSILYLFYEP